MKIAGMLIVLMIAFLGCGDTTGPSQQTHPWEEYQWNQVDYHYSNCLDIAYSVNNDSLYITGVQHADTSSYFMCNMPDIVSFELLRSEYGEDYHRDCSMAITAESILTTDDWYEYYYPYGLSNGESIQLQPDYGLGGTNDVTGVFLGEVNGNSTVVFRKALKTGDDPWDHSIETGNTYGVCIYLQWNNPGDPNYLATERVVESVVTF